MFYIAGTRADKLNIFTCILCCMTLSKFPIFFLLPIPPIYGPPHWSSNIAGYLAISGYRDILIWKYSQYGNTYVHGPDPTHEHGTGYVHDQDQTYIA